VRPKYALLHHSHLRLCHDQLPCLHMWRQTGSGYRATSPASQPASHLGVWWIANCLPSNHISAAHAGLLTFASPTRLPHATPRTLPSQISNCSCTACSWPDRAATCCCRCLTSSSAISTALPEASASTHVGHGSTAKSVGRLENALLQAASRLVCYACQEFLQISAAWFVHKPPPPCPASTHPAFCLGSAAAACLDTTCPSPAFRTAGTSRTA
jgi:hypothetical protein